METAIALTPAGLKSQPSGCLRRFDVVLLGSEFCPHLLPGLRDIRLALRLGARRVAIVSSILTDRHLRRLDLLAGKVVDVFGEAEITVNDVGALHLLAEKYGLRMTFSLGRLISRDFLKMDAVFLRSLCARYNVRLIETDDVRTARECLRSSVFPLAFHHPLRALSVTHICPFAGLMPAVCSRPCGEKTVRLYHPKLGAGGVLLRHNSYLMSAGKFRVPAASRIIMTF